MKVMPIALPTMKVAGSPTRVSSPAALLIIAARIKGTTKPSSSARATRMTTGASSTTAVALGRSAHTGATSSISPSRKRLPLPRVSRRNRVPSCSKMPVGARMRATTMPPKSSASGAPPVLTMPKTSFSPTTPNTISIVTPSSAVSTMSRTSKAISTITPASTASVTMIWTEVMPGEAASGKAANTSDRPGSTAGSGRAPA